MDNIKDEDIFVIDDTGDKYMQSAEKAVPQQFTPVNRLLKGDLKVAAKYQWRQKKPFCDDNESDDSSPESSDEDFDRILNTKPIENEEDHEGRKPRKSIYTPLDKDLYELPKIDTLSLNCSESFYIQPFGKVVQHYDALVMIKAYPHVPYLDLDSTLFNSEKLPVGNIYELMGLVSDPIYNLLFASAEETLKLPVGIELFYAPDADDKTTKILHLQELQNNSKWRDEGFNESDDDDDEEAQHYNKLKQQLEEYEKRKRARNPSVNSVRPFGPTQPKFPRM